MKGIIYFAQMVTGPIKIGFTTYVEVDEKFTTVTCSACGARSGPKGQKGLRIRQWECSSCGASHGRDVNAARNILIAALSAQRPVEESRDTNRIGTTLDQSVKLLPDVRAISLAWSADVRGVAVSVEAA